MKHASSQSANRRFRSETISERVEVPGVKPAAFKLVWKAVESYDLFRSGRKIGTARVETDKSWSARFQTPDGQWTATAGSTSALLQFVGSYLLRLDARAAAQKPIEENHPELKLKGKKTADEKLSISFMRHAQARRLAELDAQLAEMRGKMKRGPSD